MGGEFIRGFLARHDGFDALALHFDHHGDEVVEIFLQLFAMFMSLGSKVALVRETLTAVRTVPFPQGPRGPSGAK